MTRTANELTVHARESILRDAYARIDIAWGVYWNNARALLLHILSILNLDWLLRVRRVYDEWYW